MKKMLDKESYVTSYFFKQYLSNQEWAFYSKMENLGFSKFIVPLFFHFTHKDCIGLFSQPSGKYGLVRKMRSMRNFSVENGDFETFIEIYTTWKNLDKRDRPSWASRNCLSQTYLESVHRFAESFKSDVNCNLENTNIEEFRKQIFLFYKNLSYTFTGSILIPYCSTKNYMNVIDIPEHSLLKAAKNLPHHVVAVNICDKIFFSKINLDWLHEELVSSFNYSMEIKSFVAFELGPKFLKEIIDRDCYLLKKMEWLYKKALKKEYRKNILRITIDKFNKTLVMHVFNDEELIEKVKQCTTDVIEVIRGNIKSRMRQPYIQNFPFINSPWSLCLADNGFVKDLHISNQPTTIIFDIDTIKWSLLSDDILTSYHLGELIKDKLQEFVGQISSSAFHIEEFTDYMKEYCWGKVICSDHSTAKKILNIISKMDIFRYASLGNYSLDEYPYHVTLNYRRRSKHLNCFAIKFSKSIHVDYLLELGSFKIQAQCSIKFQVYASRNGKKWIEIYDENNKEIISKAHIKDTIKKLAKVEIIKVKRIVERPYEATANFFAKLLNTVSYDMNLRNVKIDDFFSLPLPCHPSDNYGYVLFCFKSLNDALTLKAMRTQPSTSAPFVMFDQLILNIPIPRDFKDPIILDLKKKIYPHFIDCYDSQNSFHKDLAIRMNDDDEERINETINELSNTLRKFQPIFIPLPPDRRLTKIILSSEKFKKFSYQVHAFEGIIEFFGVNEEVVAIAHEFYNESQNLALIDVHDMNEAIDILYENFGMDMDKNLEKSSGCKSVAIDLRNHYIKAKGSKISLNNLKEILFDLNIIKSIETCSVCLCDVDISNLRLENCGHIYCTTCFDLQIETTLKTNFAPSILCAFCEKSIQLCDILSSCRRILKVHQDQFPKNYFNITKLYKNLPLNLSKSLMNYFIRKKKNLKFCKKPDCIGAIYSIYNPKQIISCFECGQNYCGNCLEEPHHGSICFLHFEAEKELIEWIKYDVFNRKICKNCKNAVEKIAGCNSVPCTCNKVLCWLCLEIFDTTPQCYHHIQQVHDNSV